MAFWSLAPALLARFGAGNRARPSTKAAFVLVECICKLSLKWLRRPGMLQQHAYHNSTCKDSPTLNHTGTQIHQENIPTLYPA